MEGSLDFTLSVHGSYWKHDLMSDFKKIIPNALWKKGL